MIIATRQRLTEIARGHGFTLEQTRGIGRTDRLAGARRAMYVYLHQECGWSTPQIGRFFNRDHTTVVYALDNQGTGAAKREKMRARHYAKVQLGRAA